jgi:HEAT repeat protein
LAQLDDSEAAQELISMLASSDPLVHWQVVDSLSALATRLKRRHRVPWRAAFGQGSQLTFDDLVGLAGAALGDVSPDRDAVAYRVSLLEAMGLWHDEAVSPLLVQALEEDQAPIVRATAARALGQIRDNHAIDALITALSDPSFWVQRAASDALGTIGDVRCVPALRRALEELARSHLGGEPDSSGNSQPVTGEPAPGESADQGDGQRSASISGATLAAMVKGSLVSALGNMDAARARSSLIQYTEDPNPEIRWRAARGLAQIGDASALPALKQLLQEEEAFFGRPISQVANLAIEAINKDEKGLFSLLRKCFFYAWHTLRRRVLRRST